MEPETEGRWQSVDLGEMPSVAVQDTKHVGSPGEL